MKRYFVQGSTTFGRCRSCGAPVEWATLTTGARMPFDPPIVFASTLDTLGDDIAEVDRAATISHFATCPDAEAWRRRHGQDSIRH